MATTTDNPRISKLFASFIDKINRLRGLIYDPPSRNFVKWVSFLMYSTNIISFI